MSQPIVVLDACVLIPMPLSDTLLRAAEKGLYRFYTSDKILEETERNLVKILEKKFEPSLAQQKAHKKVQAIQIAFPEALIEFSDSLILGLKNDPKDRHVLATAIEARKIHEDAGFDSLVLIVTHNLKDFPDYALIPHQVKAISPDEFLLKLLKIYDSPMLLNLLEEQAKDSKMKLFDLLEKLELHGKATQFVKLIISEDYLDSLLQQIKYIVQKFGYENNSQVKSLKEENYHLSLDNEVININSSTNKVLLQSNCSSIAINNISCHDFKNLWLFIEQAESIIS